MIYRVDRQRFPFSQKKLGRALGPAKHAGSVMSQWILTKTGDVMPIQFLRSLTNVEMNNPTMKEKMEGFNAAIKKRLGDSKSLPDPKATIESEYPEYDPDLYVPYEDLYDDKGPSTLSEDDDMGRNG